MATQLTFSGDVNRISTASNVDGSIRWHVYERNLGAGVVSIYVKRELSGVVQAEVRFIRDGERPEIFFDPVTAQWIFLYEFNEQTWVVRIDETDAPVLQATQAGTLIVHYRTSGPGRADQGSVAEEQAALTESVPAVDAFTNPLNQLAVSAVASPVPGMFRVRWRTRFPAPATDYNYDVVGYHVWYKNHDTGVLTRLTSVLVPFAGYDPVLYEFETPFRIGTYYVQQVDRDGPKSTRLLEGRLTSPKAFVGSDHEFPLDVIEAVLDFRYGEGHRSDDLVLSYVDFSNIPSLTLDTLPSHYGEGFTDLYSPDAEFTVFYLQPPQDPYTSLYGEGFSTVFALTGFDTIIIG